MPTKANPLNPMDWVALGFQQHRFAMSVGETIWRRNMLMATGTMSAVEATSMWFEKPAAFAKGFEQAALAVAKGQPQVQVMSAFMRPVASSARSNAERLRR